MMTCSTPDPGRSRRPARAALALLLLLVVAGLDACAPKITKVDASYTMPEGIMTSKASLILWADEPTIAYLYDDTPPADPDSLDVVTAAIPYARASANSIHGMIIDNTQADAFQMFRREAGGGVRQFANYTAPRTAQWLGSQFEAFHFIDPAPSNYTPSTYICRGVVGGVVNRESPLTNLATYFGMPIENINARAFWWNNSDPAKGPVFKSAANAVVPKIKLKWDPVPNAARYLIQVYEFRSDLRTTDERILSGVPAPLYDGQATNTFVGYVPGNVNLMFVGDSSRTDVTIFTSRPMATGTALMVRIAALDATGHLIALTLGDPNPQRAFLNGEMGVQRGYGGNNTYLLFRLSATTARDTTGRPGGPGPGGLG
jgi:hypothetical protein